MDDEKALVYVVRREDGAGVAEVAARRIVDYLSHGFRVIRIKAGKNSELNWRFGGEGGFGCFKSSQFNLFRG